MNPEIKKLGRLTSEGDEEATRELARILLRSGYLQTEGTDHWVVKNEKTGFFWRKGHWSKTPHLYTKGWARKVVKEASKPSSYNREAPEIVLYRVRYIVLDIEKP